MTAEEKHLHDLAAARHAQPLNTSTDTGLIMSALALVILAGRISKYELPPHEAAVVFELLHRADPSFSW